MGIGTMIFPEASGATMRRREFIKVATVAIIALAVGYVCALSLRTRKAPFGRDHATSDAMKEHGVDLLSRRKTYDDVT